MSKLEESSVVRQCKYISAAHRSGKSLPTIQYAWRRKLEVIGHCVTTAVTHNSEKQTNKQKTTKNKEQKTKKQQTTNKQTTNKQQKTNKNEQKKRWSTFSPVYICRHRKWQIRWSNLALCNPPKKIRVWEKSLLCESCKFLWCITGGHSKKTVLHYKFRVDNQWCPPPDHKKIKNVNQLVFARTNICLLVWV